MDQRERGLDRLCRVCNVEDFDQLSLPAGADSWREFERFRAGSVQPNRRLWEVAMALHAFDQHGVLRPDAEILAVTDGEDPAMFLLTQRVRRVFAAGRYNGADGAPAMLSDPNALDIDDWEPRRLVAQHMDPLDLRFDDESFDGVYWSAAIERSLNLATVERAADETYRVLKPGGLATMIMGFRLDGPAPGPLSTVLLDEDELDRSIVRGRRWKLAGSLVPKVSRSTVALGSRTYSDWYEEWARDRRQTPPGIIMSDDRHKWTSVHLALLKDAAA